MCCLGGEVDSVASLFLIVLVNDHVLVCFLTLVFVIL